MGLMDRLRQRINGSGRQDGPPGGGGPGPGAAPPRSPATPTQHAAETYRHNGPRFAVTDLETTGLSASSHRILEIAVVTTNRLARCSRRGARGSTPRARSAPPAFTASPTAMSPTHLCSGTSSPISTRASPALHCAHTTPASTSPSCARRRAPGLRAKNRMRCKLLAVRGEFPVVVDRAVGVGPGPSSDGCRVQPGRRLKVGSRARVYVAWFLAARSAPPGVVRRARSTRRGAESEPSVSTGERKICR